MENIETEKQECLAIPSKSNRIIVRKRKEKQGEHYVEHFCTKHVGTLNIYLQYTFSLL
jgi:hypothetical protein